MTVEQLELEEFKRNRQILRDKLELSGGTITKALTYWIPRRTLKRLCLPEGEYPSIKPHTGTRHLLRMLLENEFGHSTDNSIYGMLAAGMGQPAKEPARIIDDLSGTYFYHRFYAGTNDHSQLNYVRGKITIVERQGLPHFEHFSHNWRSTEPEHTGYVFRSGTNLFLLGLRDSVMRLAIMECPARPKDAPMFGLVVSRRTEPPQLPFSARFIMTHVDQRDLVSRLDPARGEDAEKEWFSLSKGDYSYYMLATPF